MSLLAVVICPIVGLAAPGVEGREQLAVVGQPRSCRRVASGRTST